jgi:hypothetical protein
MIERIEQRGRTKPRTPTARSGKRRIRCGEAVPPAERAEKLARTRSARLGQPSDIAATVALLFSADAEALPGLGDRDLGMTTTTGHRCPADPTRGREPGQITLCAPGKTTGLDVSLRTAPLCEHVLAAVHGGPDGGWTGRLATCPSRTLMCICRFRDPLDEFAVLGPDGVPVPSGGLNSPKA